MSRKSKYIADGDVPVCDAASTCPWPAWSDSSINTEKWDHPKNDPHGQYLDTQTVTLPSSLKIEEWTRSSNLQKLESAPTIYVSLATESSDMICNNRHLMHSEFMRWFISTIENLRYCGRSGLEVEDSNDNFYWGGKASPWRGWFHIYSLCKAGRDVSHLPVINPHGKYIVRLYYLGCWRRFIVDDMIPMNIEGLPLLPRTCYNYELWPMLLAKALLKIASLTWTEEAEIVDFNPVACLTGWMCLNLNVEHVSPNDKWDVIHKYVTHFQWSTEVKDADKRLDMKNEKKRKKLDTTLLLPETPSPVTIFALLDDMRHVPEETLPGLAPCWSHPVYIFQTRDIPCNPEDVKDPLPAWKRHRWIFWAIKQGIANAEQYFAPIRFIKMISALSASRSSLESSVTRLPVNVDTQTKSTYNINKKQANKKMKEKSKTELEDKGISRIIDVWYNMNKLTPFIKEIQFFYKTSNFQYCTRISDATSSDHSAKTASNTELPSARQFSETTSMRSSRKPVIRQHYESLEFFPIYKWQHELKPSRNEPLFLFVDSIDNKNLLINFSSMPKFSETGETFTNCLIIEKHSWLDYSLQEPLVSLQSNGSISCILKLPPGRQSLRLFCRCKVSFSLIISCESVFHIGERMKMHLLMSQEPKRIEHRVNSISDAISKVLLSFGNENFRDNLISFCKSYQPSSNEVKSVRSQMHELFFEELCAAIASRVSDLKPFVHALRVVFLNPKIGRKSIIKPISGTIMDDAAARIQSLFKGILVRSYKRMHAKDHKDHQVISDTLRQIVDLFDYNNGESIARIIFKNMVQKNENTKRMYPSSVDFQNVLQVQECKGAVLKIVPNQWIPIVRVTVSPLENEIAFAAIHLFTLIPRYMLLVFRNEDGVEMTRLSNNVLPVQYPFSEYGYTIVAYGWSEDLKLKETEWTLHLISVKDTPMLYKVGDVFPLSMKTDVPNLQVLSITKTYVPNGQRQMCNAFIYTTETNVISVRFSTSYKRVWIQLQILNEEGIVVREARGKSSVIIPFIVLENGINDIESNQVCERHCEEGSKWQKGGLRSSSAKSCGIKQYSVQSFISFRSWPLTENEWCTVKEIKSAIDRMDKEISCKTATLVSIGGKKFSKLDLLSSKQTTKRHASLNNNEVKHPFWVLDVVADQGSGVEISQNTIEIDEFRALKVSWLIKEPDRFKRGQQIREMFIEEWALAHPSAESSTELVGAPLKKLVSKRKLLSKANLVAEKRYYQPPPDPQSSIPQFDISRYVKSKNEIKPKSQEMSDITSFEYLHDMLLEEMKELRKEEIAEYASDFKKNDEIYAQWQNEMDDEYQMIVKNEESEGKVSSRLSKKKSQKSLHKL